MEREWNRSSTGAEARIHVRSTPQRDVPVSRGLSRRGLLSRIVALIPAGALVTSSAGSASVLFEAKCATADHPNTCKATESNGCVGAAPNECGYNDCSGTSSNTGGDCLIKNECSGQGSNNCTSPYNNECVGGANTCSGGGSDQCDAGANNACIYGGANTCDGTNSNTCSGAGTGNACGDTGGSNTCSGTTSHTCAGSQSTNACSGVQNTCGASSNTCMAPAPNS
jgi:hypothetical protein